MVYFKNIEGKPTEGLQTDVNYREGDVVVVDFYKIADSKKIGETKFAEIVEDVYIDSIKGYGDVWNTVIYLDGESHIISTEPYEQDYWNTEINGKYIKIKKSKNKLNNNNLKLEKMAEKKDKPAVKRGKVRTDEDLKKGSLKEKMYVVMRTAFNVEKGKGGGYAGSRLAKVKAPGSLFGGAGKKSSNYWAVDESDDRFKSFHADAKSALSDMKAGNWNAKVAKAMDSFLALQASGGGRGAKTPANIQDVTF